MTDDIIKDVTFEQENRNSLFIHAQQFVRLTNENEVHWMNDAKYGTNKRIRYYVYIDNAIIITKTVKNMDKIGLPSKIKKYYFDFVDIPSQFLSPELLTVISRIVFDQKIIDGKCTTIIRDKYNQERILASKSNHRLCIPLTNALLAVCLKFSDAQVNNTKYFPLGNMSCERYEQRIENAILTGRSDRIINERFQLGIEMQSTIDTILFENNKEIKSADVFIGSFPEDEYFKEVLTKNRWQRVIID